MTIDFLTRVGQSDIVLNPDEFQFAGREVNFVGFRVSDTMIEPLPKYLDAIQDFPTGPGVASATSYSNCTVAVLLEYQTAAKVGGRSL